MGQFVTVNNFMGDISVIWGTLFFFTIFFSFLFAFRFSFINKKIDFRLEETGPEDKFEEDNFAQTTPALRWCTVD